MKSIILPVYNKGNETYCNRSTTDILSQILEKENVLKQCVSYV